MDLTNQNSRVVILLSNSVDVMPFDALSKHRTQVRFPGRRPSYFNL